ncbi:MAG: hypothetical protein ABIO04_06575 [Ferruginibacter sp.]
MLTGSGSLSPYRNICLIIDPVSKDIIQYNLDDFYKRLNALNIEINIEGAATVPMDIVFGNRGNNNFPFNHLIFTSNRFWSDQHTVSLNVAAIDIPQQINFSGISGLDYSWKSDTLLMTVSTEDTNNSFADGTIGQSFIAVIKNISFDSNFIKPAIQKIDLEVLDQKFKGHKIESIAIVSENDQVWEIVLASDDDMGGSVLFKLQLIK